MSTSSRHGQPKPLQPQSDLFCEVFTDTLGPIQTPSLHQNRYAIHFTEQRSRYRWIYFVKDKDQIPSRIIEFYNLVLALGYQLRCLRSDNGTEFVNDGLIQFAKDKLILRTSPPHCPQAMGVSERFNRVLGEKTRAILKARRLPLHFWEDAMRTIVYVQNRIICRKSEPLTPYQILYGMRPHIGNLRIFGAPAWTYNFDPRRRKLDEKGILGIFIGYEESSASYRIYSHATRKLIKSIHVLFNENERQDTSRERNEEEVTAELVDYHIMETGVEEDDVERSVTPTVLLEPPDPVDVPRTLRARDRVNYRQLDRYGSVYSVSQLSESDIIEPKTISEALASDLSDLWELAIRDEISSIEKHQTWVPCPNPPPHITPITTKWVFKVKKDSHGNFLKCKARLVVRGFLQEEGRDYREIVKAESLRLLLAIAATEDLEIHQVDVKTAFLHGKVEEDIYLQAPEGAGYQKGTVLKLEKSLYGIKQAPRVFYELVRDHLLSEGFASSKSDTCVFYKRIDGRPVYIAVYVDDMLIIAKYLSDVQEIKRILSTRFDLDDRREVDFILGMKVVRDRRNKVIRLHHARYI
jgi:hypothetical protein